MSEKNLKNIKKQFKKQGIYYTPLKMARYLLNFVDIDYNNAYDPACGQGNLLAVLDEDLPKYGQELDESELNIAKSTLNKFTGVSGDTLKYPAFMDKRFDFIFANPPYSVKWEPVNDERFKNAPCLAPPSKADYAFILHILHLLSDEGMSICICFPGICYRGGKEGKIRKWLIENNYIDKVIHLEGKQFTDTSISTVALILRKNKVDTNIEFINDTIDKRRMVSFSEIKENDYVISPSRYVYEEQIKEVVDSYKLEIQARKAFISELTKSINFSIMISEIEGWEIISFLNDIIATVEKIKKGLESE